MKIPKNKPGRPKVYAIRQKISVRFPEKDYRYFSECASAQNLSLSKMLGNVLSKFLEQVDKAEDLEPEDWALPVLTRLDLLAGGLPPAPMSGDDKIPPKSRTKTICLNQGQVLNLALLARKIGRSPPSGILLALAHRHWRDLQRDGKWPPKVPSLYDEEIVGPALKRDCERESRPAWAVRLGQVERARSGPGKIVLNRDEDYVD